jgi:hypothetical protein
VLSSIDLVTVYESRRWGHAWPSNRCEHQVNRITHISWEPLGPFESLSGFDFHGKRVYSIDNEFVSADCI